MLHGKRHRRRDAFFRGASDFVLTEGAAPPQTPPSRPSASEVKHASLTPAASRQPPRGRLEEDSRPPPNRGAKTVLSAPTLVINSIAVQKQSSAPLRWSFHSIAVQNRPSVPLRWPFYPIAGQNRPSVPQCWLKRTGWALCGLWPNPSGMIQINYPQSSRHSAGFSARRRGGGRLRRRRGRRRIDGPIRGSIPSWGLRRGTSARRFRA